MMNPYRAKGIEKEDCKHWYEGYYWYTQDCVYCFREDYEQAAKAGEDPRHHYILFDGFADWGLPVPKYRAEINPETLSKNTFLPDKNGKQIWENDIVRCDKRGAGFYESRVVWDKEHGMWGLVLAKDMHDNLKPAFPLILQKPYSEKEILSTDYEVIGNYFDNEYHLKNQS